MKFSVFIFVFVLWFDAGICRYTNTSTSEAISNATSKDSRTIEYITSIKTPKITIPIMIHLDEALTRTLTRQYKKTMKHYFRDVLNSLETLFTYPSLNQTVSFTLLNVIMMRSATKSLQMERNVSDYLKSYCQWQGERKVVKNKWYYSVLFTGMDIYHLDGKNRKIKSTGRGYMRGICSLSHSCSLLAWRPRAIAYIMAHEIAHSLGVTHDGPPYNQCRAQRNIMHPTYSPEASSWSSCNKQALEKFMLSSKSWCLHSDDARYF